MHILVDKVPKEGCIQVLPGILDIGYDQDDDLVIHLYDDRGKAIKSLAFRRLFANMSGHSGEKFAIALPSNVSILEIRFCGKCHKFIPIFHFRMQDKTVTLMTVGEQLLEGAPTFTDAISCAENCKFRHFFCDNKCRHQFFESETRVKDMHGNLLCTTGVIVKDLAGQEVDGHFLRDDGKGGLMSITSLSLSQEYDEENMTHEQLIRELTMSIADKKARKKNPLHVAMLKALCRENLEGEIAGADQPDSHTQTCHNCGGTSNLKKCSKCLAAHYCSRKCQVEHWGTHKQACKKIKKDK